jgi:ribosome biogenesis GTPase
MTLKDLGLSKELEQSFKNKILLPNVIGRVVSEHKERYVVKTESGEYNSKVVGKIIFTADDRMGFPVVGDWVVVLVQDDENAIIKSILPRSSVLKRQAVEEYAKKQVIASNIDFGIIVQSVGRDFNINRIERYLTICKASKIDSIIILSKVDMISQNSLMDIIDEIKDRISDIPIISVSSESEIGCHGLNSVIQASKTYCLLGSSGVGKSTLVNSLAGFSVMETGEIGSKTNRGKHVTVHRELVVLKNGGVLIDNPGMREVGIGDSSAGLNAAFSDISGLFAFCKFNDCKHINEKGCAVLDAVKNGSINQSSYDNYMRMQKEVAHYQLNVIERRKKDKDFGKIIKNAKKYKKRGGDSDTV